MRFTTERINSDISFVLSDAFTSICRRLSTAHFTRTRKMPLPKLILSMLYRRGTTLAIELRRFMKLTKNYDSVDTISKPGYLNQRLKLNPNAIMALCNHHNRGLYHDEEMKLFNNYIVLAADGSHINVPTTTETLEKYGSSSRHGTTQQASLGLSCLYDVINNVILSCSINRVKYNESEQAKAHIKEVPDIIGDKKTIITLDRGYPSLPLFYTWLSSDQKFVIRLKSVDFKRERKLMKSDDEWLDITIDKTRLANYKGTEIHDLLSRAGSIRLRIVNTKLESGSVVSVATNLHESEFSTEDVGQIYLLRWGIETVFDMLKNQLEIENFTGTKPVLIEQDIYACIYLCNLAQDMIADAQLILDSSKKSSGKHKMVINRAYAVGVMKDELINALLEPDEDKKKEIFALMIDEILENVLPVRPGRHFKRRKGNFAGKFPNNRKRCY